MFSKSTILHLSMLVALLTMVIGVVGAEAAPSQTQPAQYQETPELLHFTRSGHVLGFQTSNVYVTNGNHMLRERFVGTDGTIPQADQIPAKEELAHTLGRVSYPNLWEGVTLIYDSPAGGILRSTYQVDPGADPGQIGLCYSAPVQLDASGNLVFEFETGTMIASAPVAWQEMDGKRISVDVAFCLDNSQSTVHFSMGQYNPALPLIIDPTLAWNTFMGSSLPDEGNAIAVDGSGNIYVAGYSIASWGNPVNAHTGGSADTFAAKLDKSGVLLWNTFMGSSEGHDYGEAIAVDGNGNVYVAGKTDESWGNPVNPHAGNDDAFAAKLDASGVSVWNTFMGSGSYDQGWAITVDGSGNVYVAGHSNASWGDPVNSWAGIWDAFVAKLDSSGVSVWNTFMGSSDWDLGYGIALDVSGNIYVTGYSKTTWGDPVNPHSEGGYTDAFAAKLENSGVSVWNTFMGSSEDDDSGEAIAVDESGNVYVTGYSKADWGSPVNPYAGGDDAFVAKLNSSGVTIWTTFMGSGENDVASGIAVDGNGNVYVGGSSDDTWGNPVNPHGGGGGYDAFAAKLNSGGILQWNTFMGSLYQDNGYDMAIDGKENVYVAGSSSDTWGSPVNPHSGGSPSTEAFAAKISKGAMTPGIPMLLLDSSGE